MIFKDCEYIKETKDKYKHVNVFLLINDYNDIYDTINDIEFDFSKVSTYISMNSQYIVGIVAVGSVIILGLCTDGLDFLLAGFLGVVRRDEP